MFSFFYFFPQRIKFILLYKSQSFLLNSKNKFPIFKLFILYVLIYFEKNEKKIGSLWSKSSWISTFASMVGNRFNINHLGNVYAVGDKDLNISQKIEKQVIEWNKKNIHCKDISVEGYVSSGGTESNLFLMWMGREFLKKISDSRPTLLITDFTHYSIGKAGRILDIDAQIIDIDKKNWGMSLVDLDKTFLKYIKRGRFLFLLPITIGYSSTGASDPINAIIKLIEKLKKQYLQFNCFMWVDAAAQGLPKSFLETNFEPLQSDLIQGYVVDFHKYGNSPLPSAVVLYRSNLRKLIEVSIPYLFENDSTILGSRPGFSALAIWANIVVNDTDKWKDKFIELEKRKKYLVRKMREKNPNINVLSFDNSLTFAIEINSNLKEFPKDIEDKYSLIKCNVNGFVHYKFHMQ